MTSKKIANLVKHANQLKKQLLFNDSLGKFEEILAIDPHNLEALFHKGNLLAEMENYNDALKSYMLFVKINPNIADIYVNIGNLLIILGRVNDAIDSFKLAIQKNPNHSIAFLNLANLIRDIGQYKAATALYLKSIECNANNYAALNNLAALYKMIGRVDECIKTYEKLLERDSYNLASMSNLISSLSYSDDNHSIYLSKLLKDFNSKSGQNLLPRLKKNKINFNKIGFISGDFRTHPVGFFIKDFFNELKKNKIEIFSFSNHPLEDDLTNNIKKASKKWFQIHKIDDNGVARLIDENQIDILIDLSGHTGYNRLGVFKLKPSQIQITWLGYWSTTGINEIDFLIGDKITCSSNIDNEFSETIIRLPNTRWCYSPPPNINLIERCPFEKNHFITFGYFGNFAKVSPKTLNNWIQILLKAKNSKILLKSKIFQDEEILEDFLNIFINNSISKDRVIFQTSDSRDKYFESYNLIDIFLDTFPFSSGTTVIDSLWMGVPVITKYSDTINSRQALGVLSNIDLENFAANSNEEYVNIAVELSQNQKLLKELRTQLREKLSQSPIFDTEKFTKNFLLALKKLKT